MKKLKILIIFLFCSQAYGLEFNGKFTQGGLIIGKTNPSDKIFLDEKPLKISPLVILFSVFLEKGLKI